MFGKTLTGVLALTILLWSAWGHASGSYRLGAGDVIRVTVYEHPDLGALARIAADGGITFPLIGEVRVAGLTVREAELRLAQALEREGLVQQPQVSLMVESFESQRVSVLGQVKSPGVYPVVPGSTVVDMIAQAGGLAENAGSLAVVSGGKAGSKSLVDLTSILDGESAAGNRVVANGDRIFVPLAEQFYIYGQVNRPGVYRLERGMTVMQAVSVAGGITDRGTQRGLTINRKNGGEETVAVPAELTHRVMKDDVIFVKESLF